MQAEMDDDAESIITNDAILYISSIIKDCLYKKNKESLLPLTRIDRVVTNRWLRSLFLRCNVYCLLISVSTVAHGSRTWTNDVLLVN